MHKFLGGAAAAAITLAFASEALATEWNVSLWGKRRAFTEHVEKLAELVSEKTGGEFTLNISYGGLSKNKENLDGISIGAFEMAQFCAGYHRDKNPSITVLELPFLGVSSLEQEVDLAMALYKHPAVEKDLGRWNATLLMPSPLPQYNLVGVGDAPATLADFAGLTVRATGGIGKAMYYTSMAIIFGFGLLSFSNFIPTIYFGLLTGFAMFVALVGDFLLLPAIVILTRPPVP